VKMAPGYPGEAAASRTACQLELPAPSDDEAGPKVWVSVMTERMLSATGGRPQRTDRTVDVWLAESGVSGSEVTPVKGPWRRGAVLTERGRPGQLSLLADDAGVVVWVNGQDVEYAAFVAFAEAVTRSLRAKPAGKGRGQTGFLTSGALLALNETLAVNSGG
jgi:hypothetical protein